LEVLLPVFSVIFGGKAAYVMLLLARMIICRIMGLLLNKTGFFALSFLPLPTSYMGPWADLAERPLKYRKS
jgi:hypothetical protein